MASKVPMATKVPMAKKLPICTRSYLVGALISTFAYFVQMALKVPMAKKVTYTRSYLVGACYFVVVLAFSILWTTSFLKAFNKYLGI